MDESIAARIQMVSVQFLPFMIAVIFHEYAHGFVANWWGDTTAKDNGRLTLNPGPHIDPIGTVVFPLFGMFSGIPLLFGWAKPVPINPTRFRKFRPGLFWVSIAGVSMNFLLATISAAIFCALRKWVSPEFYYFEPLITMAYISVSINFALGIFNLLPVPPLDGSKVIEAFMPLKHMAKFESFTRYGGYLLTGLVLLSLVGPSNVNFFEFLSIPIRFLSNLTLGIMSLLFNLGNLGAS